MRTADMGKNTEITVLTDTVRVQRIATAYFISVTDITKFKNPDAPASPSNKWKSSPASATSSDWKTQKK
jgi:hypothetical protein